MALKVVIEQLSNDPLGSIPVTRNGPAGFWIGVFPLIWIAPGNVDAQDYIEVTFGDNDSGATMIAAVKQAVNDRATATGKQLPSAYIMYPMNKI